MLSSRYFAVKPRGFLLVMFSVGAVLSFLPSSTAAPRAQHHQLQGTLAGQHSALPGPLQRRNLLQSTAIDPLNNPLNQLTCFPDTTVFPYSAIGVIRTSTEAIATERGCGAALISPDTAYTLGSCLTDLYNKEQSGSARLYFWQGGSNCSATTSPLVVSMVMSNFTPSASDIRGCFTNDSLVNNCNERINYALVKLDRSFPDSFQIPRTLTLGKQTVNIATFTDTSAKLDEAYADNGTDNCYANPARCGMSATSCFLKDGTIPDDVVSLSNTGPRAWIIFWCKPGAWIPGAPVWSFDRNTNERYLLGVVDTGTNLVVGPVNPETGEIIDGNVAPVIQLIMPDQVPAITEYAQQV